MIDLTVVERLAQEALGPVEVEGRSYSAVMLHPIRPPKPAPLAFNTLSGLVDYLDDNRDELDDATCAVHVVGPELVQVVSALQHGWEQRAVYAQAEAADLISGRCDNWFPLEQFLIELQARCAPRAQRGELLEILGNVTEEAEVRVQDDGVSQTVTTRAGVRSLKDEAPLPNPVLLAPYSTFREVEQVVRPFIFRLRLGTPPMAALFEADGGAWRLEAVERVATFLREQVSGFGVFR